MQVTISQPFYDSEMSETINSVWAAYTYWEFTENEIQLKTFVPFNSIFNIITLFMFVEFLIERLN